jgi:hypothetical protein
MHTFDDSLDIGDSFLLKMNFGMCFGALVADNDATRARRHSTTAPLETMVSMIHTPDLGTRKNKKRRTTRATANKDVFAREIGKRLLLRSFSFVLGLAGAQTDTRIG